MYHLPHNQFFPRKYNAIPETFGMPQNHLGTNANLQFPVGVNTFPPPFFHGPTPMNSQGMFPGVAPGQVWPPSAFLIKTTISHLIITMYRLHNFWMIHYTQFIIKFQIFLIRYYQILVYRRRINLFPRVR